MLESQKVDINCTIKKHLQLIYPFTVLPDPTKQIINKLNSEIFLYIWDSKPDKILRTRLYQDYKNGGLRLIN